MRSWQLTVRDFKCSYDFELSKKDPQRAVGDPSSDAPSPTNMENITTWSTKALALRVFEKHTLDRMDPKIKRREMLEYAAIGPVGAIGKLADMAYFRRNTALKE